MPIIRCEQGRDAPFVHGLLLRCFPTPAEAQLVTALRSADRLICALVGEQDGDVIGYVAFSPVSAAGSPAGAGLAPVAVDATFRRQGVAAQLIQTGLDACRRAGIGWAVVLGDPAYYGRFGFVPAGRLGLIDEYGGGDAFQALELLSAGLPRGAGTVRYAPEFSAFA